ncbi:hypothetical protein BD324DRAFT_647623 [Kockovaella imperatae]|uniref:C2 domain-containing protein n=1 Tax=Kockovaella imperatae TaxID=4999 RepID=A0A1Y1UU28_9TREE|nr:hypothetical protein BD324DRAFT_647623 [Kockovaella imperatae]ORX40705.1 hypothetical protein BD324DRAFT_647623 [Kockovaella imperatae]
MAAANSQPPPLPPRKVSGLPTLGPVSSVTSSISNDIDNASDASPRAPPPPLPARKPPPLPISVPSDDRTSTTPAQSSRLDTPALTITPASPDESKPPTCSSEAHAAASKTHASNDKKSPFDGVFQSFLKELHEKLPYPDLFVVCMLLLDLWGTRLAKSWVLVLAIAYSLLRWHHGIRMKAKAVKPDAESDSSPTHLKPPSSMDWLNHTLYALFPLISTDVLAPFIDLLEDALIGQCPAIVTSVRLTSASLGAQPVLLTSLKALSDKEWFQAIAPPGGGGRSSPTGLNTAAAGGRRRSTSSSSTHTLGNPEAQLEGERRRKRDRVLRHLSRRRRREGTGHTIYTGDPSSAGRAEERKDALRPADAEGQNDLPNEEDIDAERYVNYQVQFKYDRPENLGRKGWGLHVLAYIGWGLKGVGKSEIPVYIDVLSIRGTVNVRLLLSATPPFVRTAIISFPHQPTVDLSAAPLRKYGFDAMGLPGMKSYVQASIAEVVGAFIRPNTYSLDVERLLMGRESALRTSAIGVLQIVIHSAEGLRRTDTMGSCDPYVVASWNKFNKPLFSTRTIVATRTPSWEETAYLQSGEKLRLRVSDADRFSSDDSLGQVETDLADIIDRYTAKDANSLPERLNSQLVADHPGMKASGSIDWSVRFCPIWQIPQEELQQRLEKMKASRKGEPGPNSGSSGWLMDLVNKLKLGQDWEDDRAARRHETVAWFTGEKEREEMEAAMRPPDDMRSGVFQFHIHQCDDLEVETVQGTFSSPRKSHELSAAGGRPALADVIDKTPAENTEPPSAYCEVYLNDSLVFRTRTKQVTPSPYFNAVSERFIRDWRLAKVVFVCRDERNLEHDAILGIVSLRLGDVFAERSQITRWFPLIGGLGWGRIRLSLLFKPIEMTLPSMVSGYEVATLAIKGLTATQFKGAPSSMSVVVETETDSYEFCDPEEVEEDAEAVESPGVTPSKLEQTASIRSLPGTKASFDFSSAVDVEWEINKPVRLAVQYRHSCHVVLRFFSKSGVRRKRKTHGIACIRLDDVPEGVNHEKIAPIFETDDLRLAVKASHEFARDQPDDSSTTSVPDTPGLPVSQILGFANLHIKIHPGVSKAHRKLCRKDLRFKKVYEVWEIAKEREVGWDRVTFKDRQRLKKEDARAEMDRPMDSSDGGSEGRTRVSQDEGSWSGGDDLDDEDEDEHETPDNLRRDKKDDSGDEGEDDTGFFAEARAHSRALHKRNKGIFQLKIARTGKYVIDKLQAKAYSKKDIRRERGADLNVEHEGQSSL